MSKRNIAYIKPQDPKFLQQLKQQIGYKEGPSVETKRQKLEDFKENSDNEEDRPEREDEKPQIVVLNSGDLTAEEAAAEEKRLAKEIAEGPADLSQPVLFHKRQKPSLNINSEEKEKGTDKNKRHKKSFSQISTKLSFNADEEDQ